MSEPGVDHFDFSQHYPRMRTLWENARMLGPERDSPERMQAITAEPGSAFVAIEDDIVVGGIYRTNAFLQGLVVDPRYRRRGHGRRLVEAAEEALIDRGGLKRQS